MEPTEQTLLGGSRSDPDWVNSHVSDHVTNNNNTRFRSDESDGIVQVEQGGNKTETEYSEAALKMMVCSANFYFMFLN